MPEPRRAALLDGMPTPKAVACRMLLGYPGASVGAWVDSDIIVFGRDTRVDEAITRLAGEQAADTADGIYLVDPANRLMGIVPLGALFRAPAHLRLMGLMRPAPASLPSAMPVTAALGLRAWDEALSLPVIDIRDRLVGRVQRALLFTTTARSPGRGGEGGTLIEVLGSTYWAVVSGLLAAAVSLLPSTRVPARGHGRTGRRRARRSARLNARGSARDARVPGGYRKDRDDGEEDERRAARAETAGLRGWRRSTPR